MESDKKMRLKFQRDKHGYTQEWVGNYLGIAQSAYSKIERGEAALMGDIICKLAELYGVSADYLLGREDEDNEKE